MKIRTMTLADYDTVYTLWLSCPGMGLNDLDDSPEGIAAFLLRNPETCLVAEESGVVIGVIMAGSDGRRGYIYHTAVRPDRQGCGIGAALVAEVSDALKRLGIHKVALVVFNRNEGGNAFWEKQGFTVRTDITYRNRALTDIRRIDT